MRLRIALALLVAWMVGVLGVYEAGTLVHVLLLGGLMFLPLAVSTSRDIVARRAKHSPGP